MCQQNVDKTATIHSIDSPSIKELIQATECKKKKKKRVDKKYKQMLRI